MNKCTAIRYCSECPFGKVSDKFWDKWVEEYQYNIYCVKLEKNVYDGFPVEWIKTLTNNAKLSMDKPPEECPYLIALIPENEL